MSRLRDFLNALLGRKRGTALILSTLGEFERMVQALEAGLTHIDQDIAQKQAAIQQEEAAIVQLQQVAMRAATAKTRLAALAGQH